MPPDSSVEEQIEKKEKLQKWLESHQYARRNILRYESIFGKTYVSVGGEITTRNFAKMLDLKPEMKVLDIGCGTGGSAFHMAGVYGCNVYGVDLCTDMIALASENRTGVSADVMHRVQFHIEDATSMKYPANFYDLLYSRDTILHIADKADLFKKFYNTLKPGGKLFITDYCKGDKDLSEEFKKYVAQRDYKLHTVAKYGKILEEVGFKDVDARDETKLMIEMLNIEIKKFEEGKDKFVETFSIKEYEDIAQGWQDKIRRCSAGDQCWGLFIATK